MRGYTIAEGGEADDVEARQVAEDQGERIDDAGIYVSSSTFTFC